MLQFNLANLAYISGASNAYDSDQLSSFCQRQLHSVATRVGQYGTQQSMQGLVLDLIILFIF